MGSAAGRSNSTMRFEICLQTLLFQQSLLCLVGDGGNGQRGDIKLLQIAIDVTMACPATRHMTRT